MKFWTTILIIGLTVACIFSIRGCIHNAKTTSSFIDAYAAIQDSAKLYQDKYGTAHAQNEALQLEQEQAETFYGRQIDSMASLLKIKPSQVKSIIYVPFQADINIDSLRQELAKVDTLTIPIRDTVAGRIRFNGLMSLTKYDKGTGFLSLKKTHYLDVHFDDPIFKPLNISGFDISEPVKNWSVGPYVGYGWNGDRWSPQIGISIQYSIIRF